MENLNEDFSVLHELIRTASALISPITYHDDLKRLSPDFAQKDAEKNPGCYLRLGQGSDHTLFPICNRYGYKDPQMIKFSLKLARRIAEKGEAREANGMIVKLEKLLNKYSKEVPNTKSQAFLKSQATKTFNKKMQIKEEKINEMWNGLLGDAYQKYQKNKKMKQDTAKKMKQDAAKKMKQDAVITQPSSTGGAGGVVVGGVAVVTLVLALKSLYDKYKKEKDPEKKSALKSKIVKVKSKIVKVKSKVKK